MPVKIIALDLDGTLLTHDKRLTERTRETLRKAAEQGFANAQCNLGLCYRNGDGVDLDFRQAASLFTKAAEQGYADAQYNLGILYYEGKGVLKDTNQAVYWLRKAAAQGHGKAQRTLDELGQ